MALKYSHTDSTYCSKWFLVTSDTNPGESTQLYPHPHPTDSQGGGGGENPLKKPRQNSFTILRNNYCTLYEYLSYRLSIQYTVHIELNIKCTIWTILLPLILDFTANKGLCELWKPTLWNDCGSFFFFVQQKVFQKTMSIMMWIKFPLWRSLCMKFFILDTLRIRVWIQYSLFCGICFTPD